MKDLSQIKFTAYGIFAVCTVLPVIAGTYEGLEQAPKENDDLAVAYTVPREIMNTYTDTIGGITIGLVAVSSLAVGLACSYKKPKPE